MSVRNISSLRKNWDRVFSLRKSDRHRSTRNAKHFRRNVNRRLLLESLEDRQLLAADILFTDSSVWTAETAPADLMLSLTATSINENDSTTLTGSFSDPGTLGTHAVTINWGDGSANTSLSLAAGVLAIPPTSHRYLDDNPSDTSQDSYSILVTVEDDDRGSVSAYEPVLVRNLAPTITALDLSAASIGEGQSVTVTGTFTDPGLGAGATLTPVFVDDFNAYSSGIQNANQPGTGLNLSYAGNLPGWMKGGFHAAHAVDFGAGNYAPMLFYTDSIALNAGLSANAVGSEYVVSLDVGPTTYASLGEATAASDGVVISLLRSDSTVLATETILPGAWVTGPYAQDLTHHSFQYTGDGSGDVTILIATNNPGSNRFGGAIDNVSVSTINYSETFTGAATWSDGVTTPVAISGSRFSTTRSFPDDDPTGTSSDPYALTVTISDDDLGTDTKASGTVTVLNVAPVIDTLSATSVNENGTVHLTGTYHDVGTQDTHTLTIQWGEGAPQTVAVSGGSFDITHQYLDDNPTGTASDLYTISATLIDDDGGTTDITSTSAGTVSTFATGLSSPEGLAFDSSGNLYIANYGDETISKVDAGGAVSLFASGFTSPVALAFDNSGTLFVAHGDNVGSISKVTSGGAVSLFANYTLGNGLYYPDGLTFDSSGTLYASNFPSGSVATLTPAGAISIFVSTLGGYDAYGLAFDASGNLYVANSYSGTVSKVTSAGSGSIFASGLSNPQGLAFDASGNLYVAEHNANSVSQVTPAGVVTTLLSGLNGPSGLTFDNSGNLYIANRGNDSVTKVTLSVTTVPSASTTTTVTNVAPVIDSLSSTSVNENGTTHLTGTYHDDGTQDTHTLTIQWREGAPQTVAVSGGTFDITHQYLDENPTGTPSDVYTISVTLTDDDTGSTSRDTPITVSNIAPSNLNLSLSANTINENDSTTLTGSFSDPGTLDTHTVTINWGDGSAYTILNLAAGVLAIPATSHQYLDDNPTGTSQDKYAITVTVTDDDLGSTGAAGMALGDGPIVAGTSLVVTTLSDSVNPLDALTSLREAVGEANGLEGPSTITFAPGLTGAIVLALGQLAIRGNTNINGPGAASLTISGNQASGVFLVDSGARASLWGADHRRR